VALLSTEQLYRLVWKMPAESLAPFLNISGSALSRACKSYGVPKPSTGYWQQVKAGTATAAVPAPTFESKRTRYKLTPELMRLLQDGAPGMPAAAPATANPSTAPDQGRGDSQQESSPNASELSPLASSTSTPSALPVSRQLADDGPIDQAQLRSIADDYVRFIALNQLIDALCGRLGTVPPAQGALLLQWIHEARIAVAALDPVARLLETCAGPPAAAVKQP